MLKRAPLWLLDEPTVGIDAASIGLFGQMLAVHRARGGVVVCATHVPLPLPRVPKHWILREHPSCWLANCGALCGTAAIHWRLAVLVTIGVTL